MNGIIIDILLQAAPDQQQYNQHYCHTHNSRVYQRRPSAQLKANKSEMHIHYTLCYNNFDCDELQLLCYGFYIDLVRIYSDENRWTYPTIQSVCWCCWFGMGSRYHADKTKSPCSVSLVLYVGISKGMWWGKTVDASTKPRLIMDRCIKHVGSALCWRALGIMFDRGWMSGTGSTRCTRKCAIKCFVCVCVSYQTALACHFQLWAFCSFWAIMWRKHHYHSNASTLDHTAIHPIRSFNAARPSAWTTEFDSFSKRFWRTSSTQRCALGRTKVNSS